MYWSVTFLSFFTFVTVFIEEIDCSVWAGSEMQAAMARVAANVICFNMIRNC